VITGNVDQVIFIPSYATKLYFNSNMQQLVKEVFFFVFVPVRLCRDCSISQQAITASIAWTRTCCCNCSLKEHSNKT